MVYLGNAFSINMISNFPVNINIKEIDTETAKQILSSEFKSVIGHQSTAEILEEKLGVPITTNRTEVKLTKGDTLLVAQLMQRLAEGQVLSKEEIEKMNIRYFTVEII